MRRRHHGRRPTGTGLSVGLRLMDQGLDVVRDDGVVSCREGHDRFRQNGRDGDVDRLRGRDVVTRGKLDICSHTYDGRRVREQGLVSMG